MSADHHARTWAMALHLSIFAGVVIPLAGLIAPIVIWQIKKGEFPELDGHGRNVVNWIISSIIYGAVCFILSSVGIGIPLGVGLAALGVVFPIVGAIKASSGEVWSYPLAIRFV